MLQVMSKKFFRSEDPETYYETGRKAIVYSNLNTNSSIDTAIVSLERIETYKGITTFLMTYKNVLEKQNSTTFQLMAVGDSQIVSDYLCCCSFWFGGIFSTDKFYIEKLTRTEKEGIGEGELPKQIIPEVFSLNGNIVQAKIDSFNSFIDDLIGLKRGTYLSVIKVLRQYQDALLTINSNLELAYTMFVATIESIAQNFDEYQSVWKDCPENMVKKFDILFDTLDEGAVNAIKEIIIAENHIKLSRRYESFCLKYIGNDYFREGSVGIKGPIRKSYLNKSIKNSYILRSKYVHTLKELPDLMKLGGGSEVFYNGKESFLTFSGLARLTKHIISEFIKENDKILKEPYNYLKELPGSIEVNLSSELWIYREETLNVQNISEYTNAFLSYYLDVRINKKAIINLSNICVKIKSIYGGLNKPTQKLPIFMIYVLYNHYVPEESRSHGWKEFIEDNDSLIDPISLESIVLHLLTYNRFPWKVEDIVKVYEEYDRKRFWKESIKLPQIIEVILLLEISNLYFESSDIDMYIQFLEKAIQEIPGDMFILDLINKSKDKGNVAIVDWKTQYF